MKIAYDENPLKIQVFKEDICNVQHYAESYNNVCLI